MEYLIKWKNYTDEDNTWEPLFLLNCGELITEYETKNGLKGEKILKTRSKGAIVSVALAYIDAEFGLMLLLPH